MAAPLRNRLDDLALLVLRLAGVGLAVAHGWGKVVRLASGEGERLTSSVEALGFPLPLLFAWAAALAELAGGLAIALGLATRIAAALAAFTMFVAAFLQHRFHLHVLAWLGLVDVEPSTIDGWGNPELALLYLIICTSLVALGGGRWSLDQALGRRRKGVKK